MLACNSAGPLPMIWKTGHVSTVHMQDRSLAETATLLEANDT